MSDELSPDARALLDAARGMDDPGPGAKSRVKRRVLGAVATTAAVGASGAVAKAAGGSAAAGTTASAVATSGVAATTSGVAAAGAAGVTGVGVVAAKALAVATLVGASVTVGVVQPWERSDDAPRLVVTEAPTVETAPVERASTQDPDDRHAPELATRSEVIAGERAEEPEVLEQAPAEEPDVLEHAPTQAREVPRRRVTSDDPAEDRTEATPNDLAAELALLSRAQHAHARGDFDAALAALDEHERRFPAGDLVAERRGHRAIVLCADDPASGRPFATRFLREHPRSPLARRVRRACE